MKELFGGSESQQQAQNTTKDTTPEELKGLRGPFVQALTTMLQREGRPAYPGALSVDDRPAGAMTAMGQLGAQANDPTRRGLLTDTMAGKYLPGQPGANPFLDEAIRAAQRPTLQGLEETLGRTLPGRFTQAGHLVNAANMTANPAGGSSAFDLAAARATGDSAAALGKIATDMSFQGYESERGRQQQAVQLSQQEIQGLVENLKAEWMPTAIQQWNVETGLKEFQSRMTSLLQALGIAAGSPIANQGGEGSSSGKSEEFKGIVPGIKGTPFLPGMTV